MSELRIINQNYGYLYGIHNFCKKLDSLSNIDDFLIKHDCFEFLLNRNFLVSKFRLINHSTPIHTSYGIGIYKSQDYKFYSEINIHLKNSRYKCMEITLGGGIVIWFDNHFSVSEVGGSILTIVKNFDKDTKIPDDIILSTILDGSYKREYFKIYNQLCDILKEDYKIQKKRSILEISIRENLR